MLSWSDERIMRSHPPRGGPGRHRYAPAVADDPASGDDDEAATGDHQAANVADHQAANVADQPATVDDEAATGGRSRGRSSAA